MLKKAYQRSSRRLISLFPVLMIAALLLLSSAPASSVPITGSELKASNVKSLIINRILRLDINSTINPSTFSYLEAGIKRAELEKFDLILIGMNTPGGLVTTTKQILTLFGKSPIPIVVWVTPEGASATSAGSIISVGAHLLYMSPGTNIGAATPITISGDIDEETTKITGKSSDGKNKAVNDLVALVTALAEARGKNAKLFGEMISKSSSFEAKTALQEKLIDGMPNTLQELTQLMQNAHVLIQGQEWVLKVAAPPLTVEHPMDAGQKILDIFANPSLAYILFLLGLALIYFEMQAPGGFVAGSMGAICLLMTAISFQVLPLNFGSLLLIVLSFVLFTLETLIISHGLLTLSGIVALTFGSLFLFSSNDSFLHFQTSLVFSAVTAIAIVMLGIAYYWWRESRKNPATRWPSHDHFLMIGKLGVIVAILEKNEELSSQFYQVKLMGEYWKALGPEGLMIDQTIQVTDMIKEQLILKIQTAL